MMILARGVLLKGAACGGVSAVGTLFLNCCERGDTPLW